MLLYCRMEAPAYGDNFANIEFFFSEGILLCQHDGSLTVSLSNMCKYVMSNVICPVLCCHVSCRVIRRVMSCVMCLEQCHVSCHVKVLCVRICVVLGVICFGLDCVF